MHDFPLLTTLAAAFTAAWILGLITQRLGLSPIVGYLLAGVALSRHTPGFTADETLAPQLAELGVILLMFGVGLHFHPKDLLAVRWLAIPGALGQSLVATVAGAIVFNILGWSVTAGLVTGMAMAVASTVVLMRVLIDGGRLNSAPGHAAVGWLIVEDVLTVIVLVLIPAMAGPELVQAAVGGAGAPAHGADGAVHAADASPWWLSLLIAMGKLVVMMGIVAIIGPRVVPWMLVRIARLRSRELFTLTVLVMSIAVATGAAMLFGASVALGAFLAGMMVAQSPVSQQAGADALPMRDAFAVLFFVSVGMLLDPMFIVENPLLMLAGLGIVLVAKPLAAIVIVTVLGYPVATALVIAVGLAQIGEFSFILGELAFKHGLLPEEARHLLVACAIITITINPALFRTIGPIERFLRSRPRVWKVLNARAERRAREANARAVRAIAESDGPLAIVVGHGPVGQQVDRLLREAGRTTVIIDLNMDVITSLSASGRAAIFGDATLPEVLEQAGITRATHLIVTTPHSSDVHALIQNVRDTSPKTRVLLRTKYLREATQVRQLGAHVAVVDEVESAVALAEAVLAETGASQEVIRDEAGRVRRELQSAERPSHR